MKTQSIKLAKIVTDAGTQVRISLNADVIADYAEAMKEATPDKQLPPVVVFTTDNIKFILADGFHRIAAARKNGYGDILADVRKGSQTDALQFSLSANTTHGLRRSNDDKGNAIKLAIKEWDDVSNREVATMCGVSHAFVNKIRRPQVETVSTSNTETLVNTENQGATIRSSGPPPPSQTRIGKDGKRHPVQSPKKAVAAPARASEAVLDSLGLKIPEAILPLWSRGGEAQAVLTYLKSAKKRLKKAERDKDPLFQMVNFSSALSQISQVVSDVECAVPYAICPSCRGKITEDCLSCKGMGFVSKFFWTTCVPSETKQLITDDIASKGN